MEGDFSTSVPVTTGDEIGELATSFNEMVQGLAERERIRDAFGTYLDREVADYILSDAFDEEGIELDVSVLFTDVRDFTKFSAGAEAKEVVAALNRLFEVVVLVSRTAGTSTSSRAMACSVFGAPEPYHDHAIRATHGDRGLPPGERARRGGRSARGRRGQHRPGRGGAAGGAGRLNFSVIGDAVNVAARVEEMTREIDRDVLPTPATVSSMGSALAVESTAYQAPRNRGARRAVRAREGQGGRGRSRAEARAGSWQPPGGSAAPSVAGPRATRERRVPSVATTSETGEQTAVHGGRLVARALRSRGSSTCSRCRVGTCSRFTTDAARRASRSSTSVTSRRPCGRPRAMPRRPGAQGGGPGPRRHERHERDRRRALQPLAGDGPRRPRAGDALGAGSLQEVDHVPFSRHHEVGGDRQGPGADRRGHGRGDRSVPRGTERAGGCGLSARRGLHEAAAEPGTDPGSTLAHRQRG